MSNQIRICYIGTGQANHVQSIKDLLYVLAKQIMSNQLRICYRYWPSKSARAARAARAASDVQYQKGGKGSSGGLMACVVRTLKTKHCKIIYI
jgi:hypothetical protein